MTRSPIHPSRREALALIAAGAMMAPGVLRAAVAGFTGAPALREAEASGALPPVADRLPKLPRVVDMAGTGRLPGKHGGRLRLLIGGQRDIRFAPIIGYSRLLGYDPDFNLHPDILESYEAERDTRFTFRLREGHRWSDGSPLSAEDFRYAWEDCALNTEMFPAGPPPDMLVDGRPPRFTVIDERTVRFEWDSPNPEFLVRIAAPVPLRIVLPSAYLKQFHAAYVTPAALAPLIKRERVDDWVALHMKMSRLTRPENPDLPTLEPWMPRTAPPSEQFVFARNPYFHRVDENGLQLPYIDRLEFNISSADIIPAKTGTGDSDLQFGGIDFADYTYLKDAEKRFPIRVALWRRIQGSRMALIPNLNCRDDGWRAVLRDVRVRRALSMAVDRHELNMAVFFGLAKESGDTVLPESPLWNPTLSELWTRHDPVVANGLLDAAGLLRPEGHHMRRLPDGRLAQIVVETAGESTLQTDALQLIADHWREVGIDLLIRTSQRDIFRKRIMAGEIVMSVWEGLDNGVPTADMPPAALAPTSDDQNQWPLWGAYFQSNGSAGEPPDLPEAIELLHLYQAWQRSVSTEERALIWGKMLRLTAEQVFTIGTVNQTLQPVVSARDLRNLPHEGLYGFNPTAYLGVYMPDTLWRDTSEGGA